MQDIFTLSYLSPLGLIHITGSEKAIMKVSFAKENQQIEQKAPALLYECKAQLQDYFMHGKRNFNLPLAAEGTEFQKKVWNCLIEIPYGEKVTYLSIAKKSGNINNIRAVGNANGKNPIAIIIPCHRVIGTNGKLVGYAGELWRKQWLLELEEKNAKGVLRLFA